MLFRSGAPIVSLAGALLPLILEHGWKAYAEISIGSIDSASFLEMEKTFGSKCRPVLANGIEILPFLDASQSVTYFALPERVPVCATNFFNLRTTVPRRSLTSSEVRQAAMGDAANTIQRFLNLWKVSGQASAARAFLIISEQGGGIKLLSGTVQSYSLHSWNSSHNLSLSVSLDLRFDGVHKSWSQGINEREFTFSQTSTSSSPQMGISMLAQKQKTLRVAANGRLLSTLDLGQESVIRPAASGIVPRLSRGEAQSKADKAGWSPASIGSKSKPAQRITYFGLYTSQTYPVVTNLLMWIVEYPKARVPMYGGVDGLSPPRPYYVLIDARTGKVYEGVSGPVRVS